MQENRKPRVEYVPPQPQELRDYARKVCEALAERRNDPIYTTTEVISGLAHFLEVITRIHARHLSTPTEVLDHDDT